MIRLCFILTLMGALSSTSPAQESPIPATVMVATEEVEAKDFTIWAETDLTKYDGTFSGEVGGDSGGKLTFKASKAKKDEFPAYASGSYTLTPAGSTPTVIKFENAFSYGDPNGIVTAGAFDLIFVKYGKTTGVIIGNIFIPKAKS